ncbi:PucR family transcriptional regulator ligand-binding domain-containing protein [Streptomyces sp. LHD-70]|uniref:PucR family transcriptional regulator n=1 Tax=Streptomyces sp. LHD-70 TaxID=3072140 RepID=UPI00280EE163|nr:PucR family transcriptional regulator ligand-binding domain-containing protein [Streptomyces sp. LHD-70]MDQ8705439.1 PucR family transcriptional regulator ligand-binding domain-containing protein [Streptomyces sp. LHD-70]
MRLRALLETDALGLRLLGGEDELDRTVRGVMTTDLRDPSRYLSGGELVLTGMAWRKEPADSEPFVRILASAGVAALAAGEAEFGAVPEDLVAACTQHRLPLFAVNERVAFATITEHVVRQVSGERAGDLAAVVDRHRRLMTSGPAGGGPDVVLDLLGSDLDLRAWVLSPTGRPIAGSGGAGSALPPPVCAALAAEHLAASRTGRRGPHRVAVGGGGTTYSLFPIRSSGRGTGTAAARDVRETVLSDWFLAVEADAGDWPEERLDLLQGVTQLIAVERDRRDAARTVRRRLAQEVLELVQTGAAPAEIAARLRVAAPVLLPGLGAAPHWQVVVARVEWEGGDIEGGPVAQSLLEEILVDPHAAGPEPSDRIAVAHTGDEAIALVPLPAVAADQEGAEPGLLADSLLETVRDPLSGGLDGDGRLTLGVSASVHSAEGLRGALEEARHARRVAAARPGRVCAAGHQELASHVLLLPFVPDDVRRAFTARLLDPLRDYDRRHRAELIPTLEAFLDSDGSWTRCATRLHLHVNTLRYRVGRIEQLTGRDLSRLEDKLDFFLALRMS